MIHEKRCHWCDGTGECYANGFVRRCDFCRRAGFLVNEGGRPVYTPHWDDGRYEPSSTEFFSLGLPEEADRAANQHFLGSQFYEPGSR